MSKPRLPDDEHLLATARDVALRFAAYGQYGGQRRKALAALNRRAPGFAPEGVEAALDAFVRMHQIARQAVPRHVRDRPDKGSRYAEFEDIDFDGCLGELDRIHPGWAMKQKGAIVSWCILYDYLM